MVIGAKLALACYTDLDGVVGIVRIKIQILFTFEMAKDGKGCVHILLFFFFFFFFPINNV
jgi:hypothetical protein